MKRFIPWWFRILVKIFLSRLPLTYGFWKRFKIFEHGDMHLPERAFDTFISHAQAAGVLNRGIKGCKFIKSGDGDFNVLELGPGDSLYSGLISFSLGASHTWLVDAGKFASTDLQSYVGMRDYLANMGYSLGHIDPAASFNRYLSETKTSYLTEGIKSLSQIPDSSVDFCFSNAVLEHINVDDFDLLILEMARILKPTSVSCHRVDLKDHLGGGLNSLRFSRRVWEGSLFKYSGFYTNRIRYSSYLAMFAKSGFCVKTPRIERWGEIPIARRSLDAEFKGISNDDLAVSGFDMILKFNGTK
jgi:hypothetical protein